MAVLVGTSTTQLFALAEELMQEGLGEEYIRYAFDEEAVGAEAVVAADHGTVGVAHLAVVEVTPSGGQFLDKPAHGVGLAAVGGGSHLTLAHVARV